MSNKHYYIFIDLQTYKDLQWDVKSAEEDFSHVIKETGRYLLKRKRQNKDNTETLDGLFRLESTDLGTLRSIAPSGTIFDYVDQRGGEKAFLHLDNESMTWDEYKDRFYAATGIEN